MNPIMMMKLKGELDALTNRHPKFAAFVQYLTERDLPVGTVLEITIKQPDGQSVKSNVRLTEEDVQVIRQLKEG